MSYRIAASLDTLRSQANQLWPNRSRASDGWIGDAAHQATASDHNPNAAGVVCAFDLTNDPDNGVDIGVIFELLRNNPHPDAKYLIAHSHIASRSHDWIVRDYYGDPHDNHIHVSVGVGPDGQSQPPYDDLDAWMLTAVPLPTPPTPKPPEDQMRFRYVKSVNRPAVYLASLTTQPRHVTLFADSEAEVIAEGHEIIREGTPLGPDGNNQQQNGLTLDEKGCELYGIPF